MSAGQARSCVRAARVAATGSAHTVCPTVVRATVEQWQLLTAPSSPFWRREEEEKRMDQL